MKKGIYILPNLITLSSMFCGFYSIVASINGKFLPAALVLILAGFFDVLDGKVARLTGSVSQFGVEMDSMADIISFGIAPAILIFLAVLKPFGKIGWMAAFLYAACCAMRLARFNVLAKTSNSKGFIGLPTPAAAGVIVSVIIFSNSEYGYLARDIINNPIIIALLVYLLAFLMVSNFKYHGFKELDMSQRRPFSLLILIVFFIFTSLTYYKFTFILIGLFYMSSGPIEFIVNKLQGKTNLARETHASPNHTA